MDEIMTLRYPSLRAAETVMGKLLDAKRQGPLTVRDLFRIIGVTGKNGSDELVEIGDLTIDRDVYGYFVKEAMERDHNESSDDD